MAKKRLFWQRATRAVVAAGGVAFFILLSCGEPLGPAPNSWHKEAEFNEDPGTNIESLCVAGRRVYVAITRPSIPASVRCEETNELAILIFRGGRLEDDWVLSKAGIGGRMGGLGKIGSVLWAGGTRTEGNEEILHFPVLVRNTGSGWREVDLSSNPGFGGIGRVYPVSGDACWLLTGDEDPGPWYGSLVLYDKGALRRFPAFSYVTAAYDADAETLYVVRRKKGDVLETAITRDGGSSWVYEKTVLKPFPGADIAKADILPPIVYRNELILALTPVYSRGGTWTAIYRRTGAPGAGQYELVFFSNLGPYFRAIEAMAADNSPRLMGVGIDTCLVYDGRNWVLETPPYKLTSFNAVAPADVGFYATARNETTEKMELLFHP